MLNRCWKHVHAVVRGFRYTCMLETLGGGGGSCLFMVAGFFNEDIFSIFAWTVECWGEGEKWWEEVYFKIQSSHRPKPTRLRIKTVFICYLLKAFLICIRRCCSQTSLSLPALDLPAVIYYFFSQKCPGSQEAQGWGCSCFQETAPELPSHFYPFPFSRSSPLQVPFQCIFFKSKLGFENIKINNSDKHFN